MMGDRRGGCAWNPAADRSRASYATLGAQRGRLALVPAGHHPGCTSCAHWERADRSGAPTALFSCLSGQSARVDWRSRRPVQAWGNGCPMKAKRVERVTFGYPGVDPVIQGVSFDVEVGACTALLGPNGAGKSTLLKLLVGLLRAEGMVEVLGMPTCGEHGHPGRVSFRLR
jgi:hypothetical protein